MKSTRKNLIEYGLLDEKLLNFQDFCLHIGFFYRDEKGQMTQNMGHIMTREELLEAYNGYLDDDDCISTKQLKCVLKKEDVGENVFLLKNIGGVIYVYFSKRKSFEKRIVRKIKNKGICMRYGNQWNSIYL